MTLKKIPVSDLRLGMYLQGFEGSWLSHPFWKSRFVLADPADIEAVRASPITACWIDTSKGTDVPAPAVSAVPAAGLPLCPSRQPQPVKDSPPASARAAFDDELRSAARVYKNAGQAMRHLYQEARLGKAVDAQQCLPLVEEISDSVFRNPGALVSLARLKSRDEYTFMHSVAVCALMVALGRELALSPQACREAGLAGLLHDMGKAVMPLELLNKPGKLTDDEFALIRTHPERGFELLQGGTATEGVLDVCLHHHEKMDGTGYPHGLKSDAISLIARMGAVCDVYDAITSNRPYKAGWDPSESIARMLSWKGHFDERVFGAFVKSLGIYPIGSLVRLESGRLAVVVEQNSAALTSPVVKVFFSTRSNMPITVARVDLSAQGARDRIVGREPMDKWKFPHLPELWAGDFAPGR